MLQPRREFVISASLLFAAATFGQSRRKSLPDPPTPGDPKQRDKMAEHANPPGSQQGILRKREQDFRAGVEKLFQLTSALREELKTTTTTDVLNVKMYRRVREIEKLAKQLESEAKG
ncbi:MAG: hypothetical protein M3P45_12160 [Acidobacteriota bacterium]|nr:hypothetical protein [Acidobacteriota bacterium]